MPKDNQDELFVWVDETDKVLGTITRGVAHDGSREVHRAVTVHILNNQRTKILLQKRSQNKDTNPGKWSSGVGGHVDPGETYAEAAIREAKEELGITIDRLHTRVKKLFDMGIEREFMIVFEASIAEDTSISPDPTEVDETAWCELDKLPEFMAHHEMSADAVELLTITKLSK